MAFQIIMPKLGLTMKTGTIIKWLIDEGDAVSKKDSIIEIETEKLSYNIESPADGVLLKKLASEGEKYPIAYVLGYVGQQGESLPAEASAIEYAADDTGLNQEAKAASAASITREAGERIFITPVARKFAAEMKLDFRQISGTGPNGRIIKADVLRFSENLHALKPQSKSSQDTTIPYSGIRRTIGENMSSAWSAAPMVTYHVSADTGELLSLRVMLNNGVAEKNERVTVGELLLKITAAALAKMPVINATLTDKGIIRHGGVHLGMATAIEGGLIVPVIRDADRKSLLDVSHEAKDLSARARNGALMPDEMHGGTFTVSNLGGYGSVDFFTPIINAPQAAILGVGRIVDTAEVISGEIKVRPMIGLSLTCDHRVIDGAVAAEFLQVIMQLLKNPARAVM